MKITMNRTDKQLTASIEGSIDTVTSPDLEKQLTESWDDITDLILDFSKVDYISSAGLRFMITASRHMEDVDGQMTIRHVNDDVKEVFDMTGFDQLLNIE
ncbi:MAG: STAS domain-containing protein [Thermoguttaceae bacterium]|nr:STAS domain-containing protein [Thermoguttaceae bacterium]